MFLLLGLEGVYYIKFESSICPQPLAAPVFDLLKGIFPGFCKFVHCHSFRVHVLNRVFAMFPSSSERTLAPINGTGHTMEVLFMMVMHMLWRHLMTQEYMHMGLTPCMEATNNK